MNRSSQNREFFCVTESGRVMLTYFDRESGVFVQPEEFYGPVQELLLNGFEEISVRTFQHMGFVI
jgi:hypothetical protein